MVNSLPDRLRRIREWRDTTHPGDPAINSGHWHDVSLLLNEIDRLAPIRSLQQVREAEAIVRDLAASDEPLSNAGEPMHGGYCALCEAPEGLEHEPTCEWRRAKEWADQRPTDAGAESDG
jgi:hypothetical protein